MKISVDRAREYFAHPTQQKASHIHPDDLPGDPFTYYAAGGVCGAFHPDHWPGVWMGHFAVKPEFWGNTVGNGREVLAEFWNDEKPELLIGWTDSKNRAALAFTKRLGFRQIGEMALRGTVIIMQEWRQWP